MHAPWLQKNTIGLGKRDDIKKIATMSAKNTNKNTENTNTKICADFTNLSGYRLITF